MDIDVLNDMRDRYEHFLGLPREAMMEMFDIVEASLQTKPKRATKVVAEEAVPSEAVAAETPAS